MRMYRENGFPVTSVRPSHTYGERSVPVGVHGDNGSFQVLKRMLEGKPVIVPGDGTSLWTITFNEDFAEGFLGLMGNPHAIGEAFQITNDESLTWNQIYGIVADCLGVELKAYHVASEFLAAVGPYDFTGSLIGDKNCFRAIYVISDIWQGFGWGSIVYLATIAGISPELYEAARIDGANKFRQIWHVTLPGMRPTIVTMFILAMGGLMSIGWEKAFLLQTPLTYETSDIISTFVYRKGFEDANYSYSTAVGLFNSVINLILVTTANRLSRKFNETSLW